MLSLFGKSDSKEEKKVDLDAPVSLPNSLIDEFGFLNKKENNSVDSHVSSDNSRKIPVDLVKERQELDKLEGSFSVDLLSGKSDDSSVVEKKFEEKKVEEASSNNNISSSFFDAFHKSLESGKHDVDSHVSSGLLDMMKRFHVARSRGEHFFFHEQELEDLLYKKMLNLKELEEEWVIRAREFNVAKELLVEKEAEIERVSSDLKSLLRKADRFKLFNRVVSHDVAFRLVSGKLLLSLNDLLHELHVMDDEVFKHHVSSDKNDFSDWVLHVFKEEKLALLIKSCEDKSSLVKLLSDY